MDEKVFELREQQDADIEAVAAVMSADSPENQISGEYLRHIYKTLGRSSSPYDVVVADRGSRRIVGSGSMFHIVTMTDPEFQWVSCDVLPEYRRRGIGSRLFDALHAEAKRRGLRGLRAQVRASSSDGLKFAALRGLAERRTMWRSTLNLANAETAQLPQLERELRKGGITIADLRQEGLTDISVAHRLHDVMEVSGRDVPILGPHTPIAFEEFRKFFLEGPNLLPDAWFVAKHGEEYVGMSFGSRDSAEPKILRQNYTGTLPEFRRRKVALALKLRLIEYAKRAGFEDIVTSNDSMNVPMWTLNQSLGFRKSFERVHLECVFA
jgi:mycothiol synthase